MRSMPMWLLVAALALAPQVVRADDDAPAPAPTANQPPQIDDQANTPRPQVGPAPNSTTQQRSYEPALDRPPSVEKTAGVRREPLRTTMDKPLIDTYLRTWPDHAAKAAKATIAAYGLPNEATPSMFVWIENGPWLRTTVYKDETVHDFPRTHYDVIEHEVRLKVPISKVNDVVAFEGSAVVRRTEGIVGVRSASEAQSYLAMNLINDLVNGKRNVASARKAYARAVFAIARGEPPVESTKLTFTPADDRAQDPDQPLLKNEYLGPGEKEGPDTAAPPAPPLPGPDDLRGPGARAPTAPPKGNDVDKPAVPARVPGSKNSPQSKK